MHILLLRSCPQTSRTASSEGEGEYFLHIEEKTAESPATEKAEKRGSSEGLYGAYFDTPGLPFPVMIS